MLLSCATIYLNKNSSFIANFGPVALFAETHFYIEKIHLINYVQETGLNKNI